MRYSALYSSTRSLYGVYIKKYLWGEKKKEIMQTIPAGHFNNCCLNLYVQFRVGLLVRISQLNEMPKGYLDSMIVASISKKKWIQFLLVGSSGISRFAVSVLQGV